MVALLIQAFCDVNKPAKLLERGYGNLHHGGGDQVGSNLNMQFLPVETVCLSSYKDNHENIARLLVEAGAHIRSSVLLLNKSCFQSPNLFESLQELFSQPQTLLLLSRVTIRQHLKGKGLKRIEEQLPLPASLIHDVLLTRYTEQYTSHLESFDMH